MSDELRRDEFNDRINDLRDLIAQRFDATDENFRRMNGRVGKVEDRLNTAEGDIRVLKDRGDQASNASKDPKARNTSIGAIVAAAGALLWQWWKG